MFHRGGAGEGGFDLVNLCATFGSDPFITSFAQVWSQGKGEWRGKEQGGHCNSPKPSRLPAKRTAHEALLHRAGVKMPCS